MPGCAWHKRSQWHKGLLIWCPVVLDTQVCSYDAWLSLTQRYALMTQTLFMTQALIWNESFLLWRLAVVDTQVHFYNARLFLTKKCGLMMPGCRWHEGLLLWCLAAIDTKLCSYDARLSLTQQICSFDALLSLRQWFALMISGCSWHKVYHNNNTLPVQIKICCGDGAAIPKVWSYDTRLFFDKTICCCDAWLSLTHKLALMMPDHSWNKGLLLWSPAALDTNASSKVCSDDAWLSLTQGFELMMPGCTWHNCVPLYSIG